MVQKLFKVASDQPSIVGTGLIALDVVISNDTNKAPMLWAGGTCGNVLTILSYLGWKAFPVSRMNGDIASKHVIKDLVKWGVSLDFATSSPSIDTPIVVQRIGRNSSGESFHKFIWNCPNCGADLPSYKAITVSAAHQIVNSIRKPRVFFLDRVSRGAIIMAKACAEKGALIIFEPSGVGDPKLYREALGISHILKYSYERKKNMREIGPVEGPPLEIETLGREGIRYRSNLPFCKTNGWQQISAYKIEHIVDSVGSGDWCTSGIIHILGQKGSKEFQNISASDLLNAIRFGQALATWNCGFEGARGGMYKMRKDTFQHEGHENLSR